MSPEQVRAESSPIYDELLRHLITLSRDGGVRYAALVMMDACVGALSTAIAPMRPEARQQVVAMLGAEILNEAQAKGSNLADYAAGFRDGAGARQ